MACPVSGGLGQSWQKQKIPFLDMFTWISLHVILLIALDLIVGIWEEQIIAPSSSLTDLLNSTDIQITFCVIGIVVLCSVEVYAIMKEVRRISKMFPGFVVVGIGGHVIVGLHRSKLIIVFPAIIIIEMLYQQWMAGTFSWPFTILFLVVLGGEFINLFLARKASKKEAFYSENRKQAIQGSACLASFLLLLLTLLFPRAGQSHAFICDYQEKLSPKNVT